LDIIFAYGRTERKEPEQVVGILMARCKKCGTVAKSTQKKICWKLWQLCGYCAAEEHPEAYSVMHVKRMATWSSRTSIQRVKKPVGFLEMVGE